jgi:hypothetical protein
MRARIELEFEVMDEDQGWELLDGVEDYADLGAIVSTPGAFLTYVSKEIA